MLDLNNIGQNHRIKYGFDLGLDRSTKSWQGTSDAELNFIRMADCREECKQRCGDFKSISF